jgi:hypothetical protein
MAGRILMIEVFSQGCGLLHVQSLHVPDGSSHHVHERAAINIMREKTTDVSELDDHLDRTAIITEKSSQHRMWLLHALLFSLVLG